jgi:hypothetical protein
MAELTREHASEIVKVMLRYRKDILDFAMDILTVVSDNRVYDRAMARATVHASTAHHELWNAIVAVSLTYGLDYNTGEMKEKSNGE